ncbi:acyl carrier protein [Streptomyces sudanensis]|uniref:acyl carrier protein n=1 Tax=Streptomyces sudanensis TaxID=436397 RepID=UPI0020CCAFAB|nr:acyl carrier protein [Streptomyces sudanensis]MCP9957297.1 acyl carrier protein [Streptomyces sudanensis]
MSTTYDRLVEIVTKLHDAPGDRIGPDATFAQLDVDSLTMVEIAMGIERDLGVHIDDSELREGPHPRRDSRARRLEARPVATAATATTPPREQGP